MLHLTWSSDYSVNDTVIDNQHQTLMALFNKISDMMFSECSDEELKDIFQRLVRYTVDHFEEEERRMVANQYQGYAYHKEKHLEFIKKVQDLNLLSIKNQEDAIIDLFLFLNNWLVNHILDEDKKYMGHI